MVLLIYNYTCHEGTYLHPCVTRVLIYIHLSQGYLFTSMCHEGTYLHPCVTRVLITSICHKGTYLHPCVTRVLIYIHVSRGYLFTSMCHEGIYLFTSMCHESLCRVVIYVLFAWGTIIILNYIFVLCFCDRLLV